MVSDPAWIKTAKELLGTKEEYGSKNNLTIVSWAKKIGGWVASFYKQDSIPWCGLFVAHCVQSAGLKPPPDMLAAIAWNKFGKKLDKPKYGCISVFRWASGNHHVAFIVAEDKNKYYALGGNQSDAVNIQGYPKGAAIGFRFPECDIAPEPLPQKN